MMDDRARVPFALVGVLLLVSSAALSSGLYSQTTTTTTPAIERTMDDVTASLQTVTRQSVKSASREAAATPVVNPADTKWGDVLSEEAPFRDWVRIRIYLQLHRDLRTVKSHVGDVETTATLPRVESPADLRRAKQRVHIEAGGENATALRVRVENVSIRAVRGSRVVEQRDKTIEVVVATPVLALHDRVEQYERRLNRGPLDPGLSRRVTARLYGAVWARGYAQYGGAPIQNVLANRHTEVLTNGALLEEQRLVFGKRDTDGVRAHSRATLGLGLKDLLAATGTGGESWVGYVLKPNAPKAQANSEAGGVTGRQNATTTVSPGLAADRAFLSVTGEGGAMDDAIESVYSAETKLQAHVSQVDEERIQDPTPPGVNWTLVDERVRTDTTVESVSRPAVSGLNGWHVLDQFHRKVTETTSVTRMWVNGNRTIQTVENGYETNVVTIALVGMHAPSQNAPDRPIRTVHQAGTGHLQDPNLAGVVGKARARLIDDAGGEDSVARASVSRRIDTDAVRINGAKPISVREYVRTDLFSLHQEVKQLSVNVSRQRVGTFQTNPAGQLAARLEAERPRLIDAPNSYPSVAAKARVAARAAYLDAVIANLNSRAEETETAKSGVDDALSDTVAKSIDNVVAILDAQRAVTQGNTRSVGGEFSGQISLSVDGAPAYLTLSEVNRKTVPALSAPTHPMRARNQNLFTVPYGDAADTVTAGFGANNGRVQLSAAAEVLQAASKVPDSAANDSLVSARDELRVAVIESTSHVETSAVETLAANDVGGSDEARRQLVSTALARGNTPAETALAYTNESASEAVARRAAQVSSDVNQERLAVQLNVAITTSLREKRAQPTERSVNETLQITRHVVNTAAREVVANATKQTSKAVLEKRLDRSFARLPSGLPVAPVPGYWYATTNLWTANVEGEYARFTVGAPTGSEAIAYTRAGQTATLDVDGDGAKERFGRAPRVSFSVETAVVVVVPPGGTGVGDIDGNADERSAGWGDESRAHNK
ncbi:hypothetical protein [Haladaptatus sp. DJG-WS-42]|uniref:DUF7286 family protein n=1 Tax=Haladaptatus sp. DJG-WS-42 TaxID=3120516 RepID=UPI0030CC3C7C